MERNVAVRVVNRLQDGERVEDISKELYISKSTLNKQLNKHGFRYNKNSKMWFDENNNEQIEAQKEVASMLIVSEINDLGTDRYYGSYEYDEYIDDYHSEIKLDLRCSLVDELIDMAKESNIDFDSYIEYCLLKYLKVFKPIDPQKVYEKTLKKDYIESGCDENEIKFLLSKLSELDDEEVECEYFEDDYFILEEDMDIFYSEYLRAKGIDENEIKLLEDNGLLWRGYENIKNGLNIMAEKEAIETKEEEEEQCTLEVEDVAVERWICPSFDIEDSDIKTIVGQGIPGHYFIQDEDEDMDDSDFETKEEAKKRWEIEEALRRERATAAAKKIVNDIINKGEEKKNERNKRKSN